MRREGIIFLFVLGVAVPSSQAVAQKAPGHYAGQSTFRGALGVFSPDGDSTYWMEKEQDFTGTSSDFEDVALVLDYIYFVSPRLGLLFSVGGWEGTQTQSYLDFVDPSGRDISHLTTASQVWFDVGIVYHFLSRRSALMPYVGGGASFVGWGLREEGEFIDFEVEPPTIFRDRFKANGDSFGYFLLAGLEIPISEAVSLFAEGRWRDADDELGRDFAGFGTFDLSGRSLTAGVSFVF